MSPHTKKIFLILVLFVVGPRGQSDIVNYSNIFKKLPNYHENDSCVAALSIQITDQVERALLNEMLTNRQNPKLYLKYAKTIESADPARADFIRLQIKNEPIREKIVAALRNPTAEMQKMINDSSRIVGELDPPNFNHVRKHYDNRAVKQYGSGTTKMNINAFFILQILNQPRDIVLTTDFQVQVLHSFLPTNTLSKGEIQSLRKESTLLRENASRWLGKLIGDTFYTASRFRRGFLAGVESQTLTERAVYHTLKIRPSVRMFVERQTEDFRLEEALLKAPRALPVGETLVSVTGPDQVGLRIQVELKGLWSKKYHIRIQGGPDENGRFRSLNYYNAPFFAVFAEDHQVVKVFEVRQENEVLQIPKSTVPKGGYISLVGIAQTFQPPHMR